MAALRPPPEQRIRVRPVEAGGGEFGLDCYRRLLCFIAAVGFTCGPPGGPRMNSATRRPNRAAAAHRQLPGQSPTLRDEKRIGEMKNAFPLTIDHQLMMCYYDPENTMIFRVR